MGPLTPEMRKRAYEQMGDLKYEITWTTLAEYLRELERRGVSTNVASFIGATTIREYVIGLEDKQPTPEQLQAFLTDGARGFHEELHRVFVGPQFVEVAPSGAADDPDVGDPRLLAGVHGQAEHAFLHALGNRRALRDAARRHRMHGEREGR